VILSFRKMQIDDLDEVIQIEQEAFTDAWFKELFEMELNHDAYVVTVGHYANPADGHPAIAHNQQPEQQSNVIAGYICAWQVLDECTITNIAVRADMKRNGIARFLFCELYKIMESREVRFFYLEVRASNAPAQALYAKLGFSQIGLRKAYYNNPVEDAVVMALDTACLPEPEALS
jgi:ribosomal-protein-alanine N-acetyltransferase